MKVTFFFTPTKVGFQFVDKGHVRAIWVSFLGYFSKNKGDSEGVQSTPVKIRWYENEKSIIFGWLHKKGMAAAALHLLSTQKHKDIGMGYKLQTRISQLCDTNAAALASMHSSTPCHVKPIEAFPKKSLTLFSGA